MLRIFYTSNFINIFYVSSIYFAVAQSSKFETRIPTTSLSNATEKIILKFYADRTPSISILRSANNSQAFLTQSEVINDVLMKIEFKISYTINDEQEITRAKDLRFFNVFFVDGYAGFRNIFDQMSIEKFDYSGYYLIVLTETFNDEDRYDVVDRILRDCWSLGMANVNLLTSLDANYEVAMYTFLPYTQSHCDRVLPIILNSYKNGSFITETEIFRGKFSNLHKCNMFVSTWEYAPFMMVTEDENGGKKLEGIEGMLLRELSKLINFTRTMKVVDGFTVLKKVLDGTANFSIGVMLSTAERRKIVTSSFPHTYSNWILAHADGVPISGFETIILPFDMPVWIFICIAFIVTILAIYLLGHLVWSPDKARGNSTPVLNMICVFLGGSTTEIIKRYYAKMILIVLLLSTLVLRNAYLGSLFYFLQAQIRSPPVDTIAKVIKYNYTLMTPVGAPDILFLSEMEPKLQVAIFDINSSISQILDDNFRGVYVAGEMSIANWNKQNPKRFIQTTKRRIISGIPFVMHFKKHSCLAPTVDRHVGWLINSGFLEYWRNKYHDRRFLTKKITKEPTILTMDQLNGIFYICLVLYVFSFIIFIFEILATKCKVLRIIFDYL